MGMRRGFTFAERVPTAEEAFARLEGSEVRAGDAANLRHLVRMFAGFAETWLRDVSIELAQAAPDLDAVQFSLDEARSRCSDAGRYPRELREREGK